MMDFRRLLHHMSDVVQKAEKDWSREFAESILRQARRAHWVPSPKQLVIMRKLVGELSADDDPDMFED